MPYSSDSGTTSSVRLLSQPALSSASRMSKRPVPITCDRGTRESCVRWTRADGFSTRTVRSTTWASSSVTRSVLFTRTTLANSI